MDRKPRKPAPVWARILLIPLALLSFVSVCFFEMIGEMANCVFAIWRNWRRNFGTLVYFFSTGLPYSGWQQEASNVD